MSGVETAAAAWELAQCTVKILKFGYGLMSDVRHYGKDAAALGLKFNQLSHRYDSLQKVLFQSNKFSFLQGRQLFVELPEESQKLVQQLLKELLRLLYDHFVLEKKYMEILHPSSVDIGDKDRFGLTAAEERLLFEDIESQYTPHVPKASSIISVSGWRWAFRGKKKASQLNEEFEDWLRRTKEVLEDCWWPLPFFAISANLRALQDDIDARHAGVAQGASLRRLVIDLTELPTELKTDWQNIRDEKLADSSGKMLGTFQGRDVMLETLMFPLDENGLLPELLDQRFSQITRLLNAQKDPEFRVLHCLKYASKISESLGQLRLVFELPTSRAPALKTLLSCYEGIKAEQRPSLGFRFLLCHHLAQSLYLFHSVGWIHRAFRSENILFLLPSETVDQVNLKAAELRICGFEASRLENDKSLGPYDNLLSRNVYRHPDRWGTPLKNFTQHHDIYGGSLSDLSFLRY